MTIFLTYVKRLQVFFANVFRDVMNDEVCGIPILFSTSCVMSSENSQLQNTDLAPKLFY